jgi:hypothetical protein
MRWLGLGGGLLFASLVVACHSDDGTGGSGGTGGASSSTGSPCGADQELCGDTCVFIESDPMHCGGCDVACRSDQVCGHASCGCVSGNLDCDGKCVDPETSVAHCGASGDCLGPNAGEACSIDAVCVQGACSSKCPFGYLSCDGTCVDPETSHDHCGATADCLGPNAGQGCAPGDACNAGVCGAGTPELLGLTVVPGELSPEFDPLKLFYAVDTPAYGGPLTITAQAPVTSTLQFDGFAVASGQPYEISLSPSGITIVNILVTAESNASSTYGIAAAKRDVTYVKASNTGAGDAFGVSVAIEGDTLVLGAPAEDSASTGVGGSQSDNTAAQAGAVYVYHKLPRIGWVLEAYMKASNAGAGDQFGKSVAISGDTIVVGAPSEASNATGVGGNQSNNTALGAGAAYVFRRNAQNVWSQEAYLKGATTVAGDKLGTSVAIAGNTVAVGAPHAAGDTGLAYVYARTGTSWSPAGTLAAPQPDPGDLFGVSVAVAPLGDRVAIGAPGEASSATDVDGDQTDDTANDAGAAYVFAKAGSTWQIEGFLKAFNGQPGFELGTSVAMNEDIVAVGAPEEDGSGTGVDDLGGGGLPGAGAVYVFTRDLTTWEIYHYVKATNTDAFDAFGSSVALSGDVLAVGAPGEASSAIGVGGDGANNSLPGAGAAYVYLGAKFPPDFLEPQGYVKASNSGSNDLFGTSVALAPDGTLAVGAPGEASNAVGFGAGNQADNSASGAGATYLF